MADDGIAAVLGRIRGLRERALDRNLDAAERIGAAANLAQNEVPRLLAAVDAALGHHRPRQLYGMAETMHGHPLCDHPPDFDGDAHFEGDDGIWYCRDKPTLKVCVSCADGPDGDMWAEWPCPEYAAILKALTGEGNDGG